MDSKVKDRSPDRKFTIGVVIIVAMALLLPTVVSAQNDSGGKDSEIKQLITKELTRHERFEKVEVTVEDGIVDLSGAVKLYRDKTDAEKRTRKFESVAGVRNRIEVASTMPDSELQEKLAEKLRYDRIGFGIVFNALTLAVDKGRVTVGGNARDYADRDSALAIIAGMPGVKEVVDEIDVAPVSGYDDSLRLRLALDLWASGDAEVRAEPSCSNSHYCGERIRRTAWSGG